MRDVADGVSLLLPEAELAGWRVLDVGCGTGHRLVGLAQQYPEAAFLGVDPVERSLDVVRDLAARKNVHNVEFVQGACQNGLLYLWFYHALGEHDRMLERELVRLLGGDLDVVRALGLTLSGTRYGATAGSRAPGTRRGRVPEPGGAAVALR